MESPTNVLGVTTFVLNQVVLRDIWECTLGGNPKVILMRKIKLKISTLHLHAAGSLEILASIKATREGFSSKE